MTRAFRGTALGAALTVAQAIAIGFVANAVSPNRLPWIRVPLRATHKMAASREVLGTDAPATATSHAAGTDNETAPLWTQDKVQPSATTQPGSEPVNAGTPRTVGLPSPQPKAKPVAKPKKIEALFTSLPDAKALFDRKAALFVDARHKEDYDLEHILGAVSLFAEDVDTLYDDVLGGVPKDRTIITYCSDPQCETAIELADALVARGHARVFILLEGLPGWKEAGYPTIAGDAP